MTNAQKIRPLSWGQGWLRPQRSFTGCGEGMIMQSLKRSLRFRWSSSQMEANLEASDLTAIELPPTYLRAFHSLIALDSSSTCIIRDQTRIKSSVGASHNYQEVR